MKRMVKQQSMLGIVTIAIEVVVTGVAAAAITTAAAAVRDKESRGKDTCQLC